MTYRFFACKQFHTERHIAVAFPVGGGEGELLSVKLASSQLNYVPLSPMGLDFLSCHKGEYNVVAWCILQNNAISHGMPGWLMLTGLIWLNQFGSLKPDKRKCDWIVFPQHKPDLGHEGTIVMKLIWTVYLCKRKKSFMFPCINPQFYQDRINWERAQSQFLLCSCCPTTTDGELDMHRQ